MDTFVLVEPADLDSSIFIGGIVLGRSFKAPNRKGRCIVNGVEEVSETYYLNAMPTFAKQH